MKLLISVLVVAATLTAMVHADDLQPVTAAPETAVPANPPMPAEPATNSPAPTSPPETAVPMTTLPEPTPSPAQEAPLTEPATTVPALQPPMDTNISNNSDQGSMSDSNSTVGWTSRRSSKKSTDSSGSVLPMDSTSSATKLWSVPVVCAAVLATIVGTNLF